MTAAAVLAHERELSPIVRWYLNDGIMTAFLWLGAFELAIWCCAVVFATVSWLADIRRALARRS